MGRVASARMIGCSASCRPSDYAHLGTPRTPSFQGSAERTPHNREVNIIDAYRDGDDPGARLPLLSTYLGHVDPGKTYWYLSAAPELLALAGERLQRHLGGKS